MKKSNVPHDKKYHAEIMYETERGPGFCMAWGDTFDELLGDIVKEMLHWGKLGRKPMLSSAYKYPNGNITNITDQVFKSLKKRGAEWVYLLT